MAVRHINWQIVQVQTRSENLLHKSPRRKVPLDPESFPSLTAVPQAKTAASVWSKGVASILPREMLSSASAETLNENDIEHLDDERTEADKADGEQAHSAATTVVEEPAKADNKANTYRSRQQNGYSRRGGYQPRRYENNYASQGKSEGEQTRRPARGRGQRGYGGYSRDYSMDPETLKYYLRAQM